MFLLLRVCSLRSVIRSPFLHLPETIGLTGSSTIPRCAIACTTASFERHCNHILHTCVRRNILETTISSQYLLSNAHGAFIMWRDKVKFQLLMLGSLHEQIWYWEQSRAICGGIIHSLYTPYSTQTYQELV